MDITIRAAQQNDFTKVHQLIEEFAACIKTPEKVTITVPQMLEDQDYFNCLAATNGTDIVGFATYFFSYYSWTGKAIYLDDLYVTENYRNLGIGTQLFDQILAIGKNQHCYKMRWQVSNWNQKAITFYKSKGAHIDEVEMNCDIKCT